MKIIYKDLDLKKYTFKIKKQLRYRDYLFLSPLLGSNQPPPLINGTQKCSLKNVDSCKLVDYEK